MANLDILKTADLFHKHILAIMLFTTIQKTLEKLKLFSGNNTYDYQYGLCFPD